MASRRDILRLGALGALGLFLRPRGSAPYGLLKRDRSQARVAVVGAGMAGLCAGYELRRAGHDVVLFEARDRVGGRVHTRRDVFPGGLYAEAGAARIPTHHTWTRHYVDRFGLELEPFYPRDGQDKQIIRGHEVLVAPRSEPNRKPVLAGQFNLEITDQEAQMSRTDFGKALFFPILAWPPSSHQVDDPQWPPPSLHKYDKITLRELVLERGFSEDVLEVLRLSHESGRGRDESVLAVIRTSLLDDHGATRMTIRGGMDQLPNAFADTMKDQIQLGTYLEAIDQRDDGVLLHVMSHGRAQTVEADYVICALPLPLLREVEFRPGLPERQAKAVQTLGLKRSTRAVLMTESRPWKAHGLSGFGRVDAPAEFWDTSHSRGGENGLLAWYARHIESERMASMSESERLDHASERLRSVLPGARFVPGAGFCVCWDEERWSRGQVSFLRRGELTEHWRHLHAPHRRVHFAGEHLALENHWINSALLTGFHAADAIHGSQPRSSETS